MNDTISIKVSKGDCYNDLNSYIIIAISWPYCIHCDPPY